MKRSLLSASIVSSFISTTSPSLAQNSESYVARIEGKEPIVARVVMDTKGFACKIIDDNKVYILPRDKTLPGTDFVWSLTDKNIKRLKGAENCENKSPSK